MDSEIAFTDLLNIHHFNIFLTNIQTWFFDNVLVLANLAQFAVIATVMIVAYKITPILSPWIKDKGIQQNYKLINKKFASLILAFLFPIIALSLLWLSTIIATHANLPHHLITIVVSLLAAWVVIRLSTRLVEDPVWANFISVTAWTIAALNIVGLLDATITLLDNLEVTVGSFRISALIVIKAILSLAFLVWLAAGLSQFIESRIRTSQNLSPSVQVLLSKLLKITLITIAIIVGVSSVGIDLTALAVFGGALGVGIGLGLQKAVSNLTSGLMLLMDKSIKPGDVIAVNQTYGWVNSLGARYVSVITRDGIEHLIPNDDLVTQRVENWTHSNNLIRLKTPVGIHYRSDIHKAIELCLEAVNENPRIEKNPEPKCLLRGFGDNSVDLEIRMWIQDPQNGVNNIRSEVLLRVWELFHEYDIEIPYPQRDLHIRTPHELRVKTHNINDS